MYLRKDERLEGSEAVKQTNSEGFQVLFRENDGRVTFTSFDESGTFQPIN
jgi:hypothetical protein